MIAMPFHPSNVYTIDELNANLADILHDVEQKALVSLDGAVDYSLQDKIRNGKFYVEQGIIAGCAGGGFENICAAADIIKAPSRPGRTIPQSAETPAEGAKGMSSRAVRTGRLAHQASLVSILPVLTNILPASACLLSIDLRFRYLSAKQPFLLPRLLPNLPHIIAS